MVNNFFNFDDKLKELSEKALELCFDSFRDIEKIQAYNQQKMLKAFQLAGVSESHFAGSTGYGYDDRGREILDKIYAYVFDAEDALVRHNFVSGTHTLAVALFGMLRPGDEMVSVTGTPYDTIQGTIGINSDYSGSLKDFGVKYSEVALKDDGTIDLEAIREVAKREPKMIYIQRSRGYSTRDSLLCKDIKAICDVVREVTDKSIIMLDNCYGEFVECDEPLSNGVDIMAGSLIKNPGGGITPTGGYIAGRADLVEMCSYRLTTPGTGKELGCTLSVLREMFMGAFHAPQVVGEALKTAVFTAALFELLGYEVSPSVNDKRGDIIEVIKLHNSENLIAFCKGIQAGSPVDSFVTPYPSDMPGYDSQVIMAAGAFTLGSSIELSADAPLREPYAVWMQGGLNFNSSKIGIMLAAQEVMNLNK